MKVVAIIQARMGASRLPGKMLMDIAGKPAIAHVLDRVKKAKEISTVVVATTVSENDTVLASMLRQQDVLCFRGSEQDVLDRYYRAGKEQQADAVVRVTGDCPLMDPDIIDMVVRVFFEGGADYVSNIHPPTYPDGLDVEVCSFHALEKAWKEADLQSEREHVTPYIWKHPELFKIRNVVNDTDVSNHRWTLDTQEDLEFLNHVLGAVTNETDFKKMLEIILQHPEWQQINAMHERNEGYRKSLVQDK